MKRRSNGMKTVPQIFISGDYYGDEERLFADDRDGRLDAALRGEPFAE
jgi:glutaredoxin